jgi:hypothetical protein
MESRKSQIHEFPNWQLSPNHHSHGSPAVRNCEVYRAEDTRYDYYFYGTLLLRIHENIDSDLIFCNDRLLRFLASGKI